MIVIMFLLSDNITCKPLHMPNMSRLEIGGFFVNMFNLRSIHKKKKATCKESQTYFTTTNI